MSPYENRLQAEPFRRIGLTAEVKPDALESLDSYLSRAPGDLASQLKRSGIYNIAIYRTQAAGRPLLFVYFETTCLDQEEAIPLLKESSSYWVELESLLVPHPRAGRVMAPWIRAEFINVVSVEPGFDRPKGQALALAAQLVREKELSYRTLHQTNWPGVVDQMRRSNYRNWTTFLIDWEGQLLLFTYAEYLGDNREADEAAMARDPVSQRWWSHTQPCLAPVDGSDKIWSPMRKLAGGL